MDENTPLKEIFDDVRICIKCGKEYGYDIPKKFKKNPDKFKDSGLCPFCDPILSKKLKPLKPKGLNTSEYSL